MLKSDFTPSKTSKSTIFREVKTFKIFEFHSRVRIPGSGLKIDQNAYQNQILRPRKPKARNCWQLLNDLYWCPDWEPLPKNPYLLLFIFFSSNFLIK